MQLLITALIILYYFLFNILTSYADETPYTDVSVCEKLAQKMDGQSFANLFEKTIQIKLGSHRNYAGSANINGCYITINATITGNKNYQEIGSILVFRHKNAFSLYQKTKQEFADKPHIHYQPKILPFIEDGFIDKTNPSNSTFNAYLKNQFYLILIIDNKVERTPRSTVANLSPIFIRFINIATQQIANSQ